jgi:type I protein arginine methyltransferase
MYSIADYWKMMGDHVRRDAYGEALRRSVRPGSVVVNIGTGTGVFALQACRLGARRVVAIEPDAIIEVARELAAANGFADRIELIQGLSTDVTLDEPADVVVSDLRGVLPLHGHHLPSVRDAKRFLGPGGVLIPQRDVVFASLVEAPDIYRELIEPWGDGPEDLDFRAARRFAVDRWTKARFTPDQLLVPPQEWLTLDYTAIEGADVRGELRWVAERPGTAHGICAWFEATLVEGVSFSTGPDQPERIYGSGFFPLNEPVELAVGDAISIVLAANLVGDAYVWRWRTHVEPGAEGLPPKADFSQSNFAGAAISPADLRVGSPDATPQLNSEGEIERAILEAMTGTATLRSIADGTAARFPDHFPSPDAAMARVRDLARRYGR